MVEKMKLIEKYSLSNKLLIIVDTLENMTSDLESILYLLSISDFYNKINDELFLSYNVRNINNLMHNTKELKETLFFLVKLDFLEIKGNSFKPNSNTKIYVNNIGEETKKFLDKIKCIVNTIPNFSEHYYYLSNKYMSKLCSGGK